MIIYKITFPSNKVYIGQTIEPLSTRISHHKTDAKLNRDRTEFSPSGSKICNAIRKYGLDNSWIEIIDTANSLDELNNKEIYWIKYFKSLENGYNIKPGGNNKRHSEETKIKIGNATKERWKNPEIAARMREGLQKGVDTMKSRKGETRIERIKVICQLCGKEFQAREKEKRKFCSRTCSAKNASNIAAGKKKLQAPEYLKNLKDQIYEWSLKNSKTILNCPMNKISTNLDPLKKLTGVDDWRTLEKAVNGKKGRKDFLEHLKNYVKMYAEPDRN
jgi:group I intron endonuclease